MWQTNAGRIAGGLIQIEPERCANLKVRPFALKNTNAELRPLKVGQNTNRPAGFVLDFPDDPVLLTDLLVAAVAHVQTKDIRTCFMQCTDHLACLRGRPKGGHDLYIAQTSHICSFVSYVAPRAMLPVTSVV